MRFAPHREMARVAEAKSASRVVVLVCGPRTMVDEVTSLCTKGGGHLGPSGTAISFELHSEVFQL